MNNCIGNRERDSEFQVVPNWMNGGNKKLKMRGGKIDESCN